MADSNLSLLIRMIEKLRDDTDSGCIEWENGGDGKYVRPKEELLRAGLLGMDGRKVLYFPAVSNPGWEWLLSNNVTICRNFSDGKDLFIIPYSADEEKFVENFDYFLADGERWEKILSTAEDISGELKARSMDLYVSIFDAGFEGKMDPAMRRILERYVGNGQSAYDEQAGS